ncbi:MAG TPA: hypothetical protein VE616_07395 [Candidatus Udaeobacter sp.]|nr:hypothetical protein [Candidatus Udaeobacter sp.]
MKDHRQTRAAEEAPRNFRNIVGEDTYAVWVRMLRELVPDGRTHRLSVMLAGMLHYAAALAAANQDEEEDEHSLVFSLIEAAETSDPSGVKDLLHDAVVQLFKDAKVRFERTSARSVKYNLAEEAYEEFIHWHDMPWE